MLEPLVRSNLPRLQNLYEHFPSPARHVLTSARGWLLTQIRYSPETFAFLEKLRASETINAEQIMEYQLCELRRILQHAVGTVPFYSGYPRTEIRSLKDLRNLPVLSRDTVLQNQERPASFTWDSRAPANSRGHHGAPRARACLSHTREAFIRHNWAFLLRQRAWAGVAPRHPRVTFQGSRVAPSNSSHPPYWTWNLPERQVLMSIFHLSEGTAPAYLDFLQKRSGDVLEGFPSVLTILADFALDRGLHIPMRAVFTSGEPVYPDARAKIEEAFKARVFDTYGMTEYCGLIQECGHGQMHLAPEYGLLEILDENDQPVSADQEGYFVWTGFLNEAMPLIRYRIGDRGRWQDGEPCPCGRAFARVVPTITRESDILRCPDGRLFSPRALNQLLKESDSLRFCQFVHDRADHVTVRAMARPGKRDECATQQVMKIRASLEHLLGTGVVVAAGALRFAHFPATAARFH